MKRYCKLLSCHPWLVLLTVTVLVGSCLTVSLLLYQLPTFNDPALGFEARGTPLSNRNAAWKAMLEATRSNGPLAGNPFENRRVNQNYGGKKFNFLLSERRLNLTMAKLKHIHMVCVEAVAGSNVSIQHNCSREDLQKLHFLQTDEEYEDYKISELFNDTRSVVALESAGDSYPNFTAIHMSSLEKLRQLAIEYDLRNANSSEDYLLNPNPMLTNEDFEDHEHTSPDGFFCNALMPSYGHVILGLKGGDCSANEPSLFGAFSDIFSSDDTLPVNRSQDLSSLLTYNNVRAMCSLDHKLRETDSFKNICQTYGNNICCPSWSLPNYVAMLANRTHCHNITQEDVSHLNDLLFECGRQFDVSLSGRCSVHSANRGRDCSDIPPHCMNHDAVYTILHYLTDANFLARKSDVYGACGITSHHHTNSSMIITSLQSSALFLPVTRSASSLQFYQELSQMSLTEGNVTVVSMALGVKNALFDKLLIENYFLVMIAGVVVVVLVFLYTASLFITLITLATIVSSMILSYFLYTCVLGITFFPYMNVLTAIIAVGLGADDVFVFCRVWRSVLKEHAMKPYSSRSELISHSLVYEVMNHAASSVIVTSLTTAAAFLASMTSAITAIKCFSLFAGGVVLSNLFLMLTWVPATLVIAEKFGICFYCSTDKQIRKEQTDNSVQHQNPTFNSVPTPDSSNLYSNSTPPMPLDNSIHMTHSSSSPQPSPPHSIPSPASTQSSAPHSPYHPQPAVSSSSVSKGGLLASFLNVYESVNEAFFNKFLPWAVFTPRLLWVVLFAIIGIYATTLVLYFPGLQLPNTSDFQLFQRNHYLERYDLDHKYNFWFERNLRSDMANRLPIRIVWGLKPVDNGDHFDPSSNSKLELDRTFDISAPQSQSWMLQFCRKLRNQTFYMSTLGPLLPNCFIETFKSWMEERKCKGVSENRYPCCDVPKFPYPRWVFNRCVSGAVKALYQTPRIYFVPGVAGPKFNKTSKRIEAMVVEYDSNFVWSLSYQEMHKFFTEVEEFTTREMESAPTGMRGGWFISFLEFYEVQRALSEGTTIAIAVAIAVTMSVLLLSTCNIFISILAVVTVGAVIMVTLAGLVMLGWRLNILESIVVTAAIGLAVDLTLHYAVAYKKAPTGSRKECAGWALKRLASPVLMTTLTTLAAAIAIIPATVLAYIHIATFLILISLSSYIYSTFFFLPLMSLIGPEESCGKLNDIDDCSSFCNCREDESHDKSVYHQTCASESTLSTTSVPFTSIQASQDYDTTVISHAPGNQHEFEPLTSPYSAQHRANHRHPASCKNKYKSSNGDTVQGGTSLGMIVNMQQNRPCKGLHQNGSCAQLVLRKESCESQGSVGEDSVFVSRSASLGSKPDKERAYARTSESVDTEQHKHNSGKLLKSRVRVMGIRPGVEKQDSSPQVTPTNSLSTLVYSEPDALDLECDDYRSRLQNKLSLGSDSFDNSGAIHQQENSLQTNKQQQIKQKQFAEQRHSNNLDSNSGSYLSSVV